MLDRWVTIPDTACPPLDGVQGTCEGFGQDDALLHITENPFKIGVFVQSAP